MSCDLRVSEHASVRSAGKLGVPGGITPGGLPRALLRRDRAGSAV